MSENLNLSSSLVSLVSVSPVCLSNLASIVMNTLQSMIPTIIIARPTRAGRLVSAKVYRASFACSPTRTGESTKAIAVPSLAIASCAPIAKAISLPLNHLAMERVTATPAISLPRPNSIHPTYASHSEGLAIPTELCIQFARPLPLKLEEMAYATIAAPPTIIPTKIEPVTLTPHLSRSIPQIISPPHTQRKE